LKNREDDLAVREETLADKEKEISQREAGLADAEAALGKREAELAEKAAAGAQPVEEDQKLTKAEEKLIAEAMEAYGIDEKYVLKARTDRVMGQAVIVTHGGSKVRYSGDEGPETIEKLTFIQITGINPNPKKKK
jgi:hypothetical protein